MSKNTLAYLLIRFPAVRETFVSQEILGLMKIGWNVQIFSLLTVPCQEVKMVLPESDQCHILYARPCGFFEWQGTGFFLLKKMLRIAAIVLNIVRKNILRPMESLKLMGLLAKTIYIGFKIEKSPIQHLHVHFASYGAISALWLQRMLGISFSVTIHAYDLFKKNEFLEEIMEKAKGVVTISDFNRQWIEKLFGKKYHQKVQVIRCGVDLKKFFFRKNDGLNRGRPFKILYVAGFVEKKGHILLLDVLEKLKSQGRMIDCELIGDGPLLSRMKGHAERLGILDQVHFLGARSHDEVRDRMLQADCFVMPAITDSAQSMDGIPVALMEAMAIGLPVIASRLSGIPELVIHGETGLLVQPGERDDLVKQVLQVQDQGDIFFNIVRQGRKKIEQEYDLDQNVFKMHQWFLKVLA